MNNKLLFFSIILALLFGCKPNNNYKNNSSIKTTKADTLDGFYHDSIKESQFTTDSFYIEDPKKVEEEIHEKFIE